MENLIEEYRRDIIRCLQRYGNLSHVEAGALLERSKLLDGVTEESAIFHELPYFWAMHLLYAETKPDWYHDPNLWPPPQDYIDMVKGD